MFRPDSNRDRTDYSGILMPPDGYRLDRAVGTTYSLDLEGKAYIVWDFLRQNHIMVKMSIKCGLRILQVVNY